MYKNLHFKIILIFVVFTVTLMAAISAVLIVSSNRFYSSDFQTEMKAALASDSGLVSELRSAMTEDNFSAKQNEILRAYSGTLGISKYRNYYILDMRAQCLTAPIRSLEKSLK